MRQRNLSPEVIILFIIPFLVITAGCSSTRLIRELSNPSMVSHSDLTKKHLKVHMKDGSLYVLDSLITYSNADYAEGYGTYLNPYRDIVKYNIDKSGIIVDTSFHIMISEVALLEANRITGLKGKILALALVGVPTAILTIYCITNPKACFGSCPTFYSWDGSDTTLMAEGFSSSILKAFEKEDIDMLYWTKLSGNIFHLQMKNEALETHIVRQADLLVVPRPKTERVFATENGEFFETSDIQSPVSCNASEGDCLDAVKLMDHKERYCTTDPKNLASKEFIEMHFENVPGGKHGLIIGCKQTLLTTYLFYQSLANLGNSAGYFASRIESGDKSLIKKVDNVWNTLGGIEISIQNQDGKWEKIDEIQEMGPIASDVHLVKLPEFRLKNINIRLKLTKGLWRIDYLALGNIDQRIDPIVIEPSRIIPACGSGTGASSILDGNGDPLVTFPGDVYDIFYELPDNSIDYEIFLKSKGYYLEWIRESWLGEENLKKAAFYFMFPRLYMKKDAGKFKILEPSMEESFWSSKYVKKS
ncbi:MAG: hypothetical protein MUC93_02640 [Bacteroidales bacterium]|jgi:hypothetical protein|nr:hypothetical protein [Bacteroidales bacterium]